MDDTLDLQNAINDISRKEDNMGMSDMTEVADILHTMDKEKEKEKTDFEEKTDENEDARRFSFSRKDQEAPV